LTSIKKVAQQSAKKEDKPSTLFTNHHILPQYVEHHKHKKRCILISCLKNFTPVKLRFKCASQREQTMYWRLLLTLIILQTSCNESSDEGSDTSNTQPSNTRSFFMGFTPWPYEATLSAITHTYTLIQDNGDIVSHHLMSGIPWEAAYNKTPLPTNVENDISAMINQTREDKVIYLAIDSLNAARNDLAQNWGNNGEEARPSPWDTRKFNDPETIEAYSHFALSMIERFKPMYFNYAPEISELILNDNEKFNEFTAFADQVSKNIKHTYPDLPLMVSVALKSPNSASAVNIESGMAKLDAFIDMIGISVYPYAFYEHNDKGDPNTMPPDWVSQISSIAKNKPIAVTETGWIAEDLSIATFGYSETSDNNKQKEFLSTLLTNANDLSMEFVIWFSVVDYDSLWNSILGQDDVSKLWKDTGLYDENLNSRPAMEHWRQYYLKEKN